MSLVVAIKDKDRIVLGADKQASISDSKDHTSIKIWPVCDLPGAVMGGVGSARASQIIQYSSIIDKNNLNVEPTTDFVICSLAPTIAATLKSNGVVVKAGEVDICEMMPNAFIFAYKDRAWLISHDLSVIEIENYLAIGSGSDVAKGVLYATPDKDPFQRVVTSIEAASEYTLFVDDGLDLLVTGEHEEDKELIAKALGIEFTQKPKKEKAKTDKPKKEAKTKAKK